MALPVKGNLDMHVRAIYALPAREVRAVYLQGSALNTWALRKEPGINLLARFKHFFFAGPSELHIGSQASRVNALLKLYCGV